jgi:VIT1/CCC1 family predicted Fe2+/Mn2+ transporter
MARAHSESHNERMAWLRAAVLGANDGIVSTASLMMGVATADGGRGALLFTKCRLTVFARHDRKQSP